MGAVQFVLQGGETKKVKITYNERQKIYKEQNLILMSNFVNSQVFQDDITKLISGNVSEGRISDIIKNYSPDNSKCKIPGLNYPRETILTYATGILIQNNRLLDKNFNIFKYISNAILN